MIFRDLREWMEQVDKIGELRTLTGVHWDLDMGRVTDIVSHREGAPTVVFDEIPGYPKGFRVLVNFFGSWNRLAMLMALPVPDTPLDLVKAWRAKLKEPKLIPPKVVKDGPILENVKQGKDIDLLAFPVPRFRLQDGGRYIGTGSITITRDPEEGWVNLGTYRVMLHDATTLGFYISPGKHGRIHREKYLARGEPCKVAISFGQDPQLFLASSVEIPYKVEEYQFVGGLKGEPIDVIEGEYSGLPLPARAEIVIEGEAIFNEKRDEGPLGEWTGYYASGKRPEPIIKVKRLYYRNDPIITGVSAGRPPSASSRTVSINRAAMIWDELEKAGVPDVKGVWCHPAGGARLFTVVSIKQRYPGHARQAGMIASFCHAGAYTGRYVVVLDDDIDPSNTDDVIWAMTTRSDPQGDIEIIRRCWSTPLDPMIRKGQPPLNSRAIIDACRPYEWLDESPDVSSFPPEELQDAMKRYGKQLFP